MLPSQLNSRLGFINPGLTLVFTKPNINGTSESPIPPVPRALSSHRLPRAAAAPSRHPRWYQLLRRKERQRKAPTASPVAAISMASCQVTTEYPEIYDNPTSKLLGLSNIEYCYVYYMTLYVYMCFRVLLCHVFVMFLICGFQAWQTSLKQKVN